MSKRTTLVIQDQVNIKFKELDPFTRRKISESLKFMVPYARHMPSFKLGRWDGKVSFATVGGSTYLNLLDRVLPIVLDDGYEIDIEDLRPQYSFSFPEVTENFVADRTWPEGHPMAGEPIMLREHQCRAINTYLKNPQSIQSISTSAGKAQPLWSKIKTPFGWTTMGEIKVGDEVATPDGKTAKVIGLYPQGMKPIKRLTFKDGRTAEACDDHLWEVYCPSWHATKRPWRIETTRNIEKMLALGKTVKVRLPKEIETKQSTELPIDPYTMGALIGDGCFVLPGSISLTCFDMEIVDRIKKNLAEGYILRERRDGTFFFVFGSESSRFSGNKVGTKESWNLYVKVMEDLGLKGKKSHDKFIPEIYLNGTVQDRYDLLQGILDTDGCASPDGCATFRTSSEKLAKDVIDLVRSLGGWAKISRHESSYTKDGCKTITGHNFNVSIKHRYPRQLFSLNRKKERMPVKHKSFQQTITLARIEDVGCHESQCIMIDHPEHLYLTDNYVVTHNTIITGCLSMLVEPFGRSICIVPSKSLVEQTEEDYRNLGLDVGVFYGDRKEWNHKHTICTWQSLTVFDKKTRREEVDVTIDEFLEGVVCVMVDETHSAQANELKELLCGPMAHIPLRWGLTGTVPKEDHQFMSILAALGPVVGEIRAEELQKKGILSNCHVDVIQTVDNHVEFTEYHEAYKFLTTDKDRIDWLTEFCKSLPEGNKLILVDRIETGELISEALGCDFISGNVKTKDRKSKYKEVKDDTTIDMVATYGVAAVGVNIPALHHLVLIEAGKSFVRVIQSIGRGLRKTKVKDFVNIYDICSTNKYSAKHLTERKKYYKEAGYPFEITKVKYR